MVAEQTAQDPTKREKPFYDEEEELGGAMTFLEHLGELRERLIRTLVALGIAFVVCFTFSERLLQMFFFCIPEGVTLQATSPVETLITELKISLVGGIFIAFPIIFYQAWMFVAPGLYKREKKIVLPLIASAWFCFVFGGIFCYYATFRFTLQFLESITPGFISSDWKISEFVSFSLNFILAFGLVFEEPVLILLLARIGLVTQKMLWNFFPYALIIMFTVAAVITPPDPISQIVCAVPLVILYVLSVFVVHGIEKKSEVEEIG
ncbi:MAG: twin-arginine translocase subunit TatC [Candidatus Omnitrophota bacterium]